MCESALYQSARRLTLGDSAERRSRIRWWDRRVSPCQLSRFARITTPPGSGRLRGSAGRASGSTAAGAGGGLRRRQPARGRGGGRDGPADPSRLSAAVQRRGAGRADRPPGSGADAKADARAAGGRRPAGGGRPDPGHSRVGALAADRPYRLDSRRIRRVSGPSRLGRILKALGYRRLSARPRHHAQNPPALEAFKRDFPRAGPGDPRAAPQANPA